MNSMATEKSAEPEPLSKRDFEALTEFRFGIRRYLRFSEETVRSHGLTPQHYQLFLALKGFPGREVGDDARAGRPAPARRLYDVALGDNEAMAK
ncbi:MAG: hypothetical protein ACRDQF_08300 [Thermocrispum sp.]